MYKPESKKTTTLNISATRFFLLDLLPTALRRVEFIKLATEDREQNG